MSRPRVHLCLGSNLGDRLFHLAFGVSALDRAGVEILRRSSIYETEPTDLEDQPWFLNQVLAVETELAPADLLALIQDIERTVGPRCGIRFGPRALDIDILLIEGRIVDEPALRIPHPRLLERRFMLTPLIEIAPDIVDPRDGHRLIEDLEGLDGKKVTPFRAHAS